MKKRRLQFYIFYNYQTKQQLTSMLEKNQLFKRIENNNVFRTFSRTYSKPFHASRSNSSPKTSFNIKDYQNYTTNLNKTTASHCNQTENSMNFTRSPQEHHNNTINENQYKKYFHKKGSKHAELILRDINFHPKSHNDQMFKRNLTTTSNSKRLEGESLPLNLPYSSHTDIFKLKACAHHRKMTYQGEIDEGDFSTLQFKKTSMNNICKNKIKSGKISSSNLIHLRRWTKPIQESNLTINRPPFTRYTNYPPETDYSFINLCTKKCPESMRD